MEYAEALEVLAGALKFGINPSLQTITSLCEALGRPQDAFTSVQVTGTNGKSSTSRILEAILRAEGVRTGLYTSPELERYPERIEVMGRVVDDDEFATAVSAALNAACAIGAIEGRAVPQQYPTEFELLTAAALWLMRERGVELAVLEVGMGGRWDATSIVAPKVAVVTGVGLDHTAVLGETVEAIAAEKAAIIRPGSIAVLGSGTTETRNVFMQAAGLAGATVVVPQSGVTSRPTSPDGTTKIDVTTSRTTYEGLTMPAPAYQADNLAVAIAAAEAVLGRSLDVGRLQKALDEVRLPGRFELVCEHPPVIVDGSHNPQAAAVLAQAIGDAWPDASRRPLMILGVLADKDARGVVKALQGVVSEFVAVTPPSARALGAAELAKIIERVTGIAPRTFADVESAIAVLVGQVPDGLIITGSLTAAGRARAALRAGLAVDFESSDRESEGLR